MLHALSYKTKQFLLVLIKLSIVVAAFYFIAHKLFENDQLDFRVFTHFLFKNDVFSAKNILFLLFLSIFNWFFEILKWNTLVNSIQPLSFKKALEQSLAALTTSLITPNRIGDYGAKAIYYNPSQRKKILLLNVFGNMAQMTATVIFGVLGLFFFMKRFGLELNYLKFFSGTAILILIVLFIGFGSKQQWFKIKGLSANKISHFIKNIQQGIKIKVFIYSTLRYMIFSFQFYVLLYIFKTELTYMEAMIFITTMYFLASVIPSIFIFDVLIKGSVAVYVFGFLGVDDLTVLSIITLMWLLNFVLPSIFGSYYVLNFKLLKNSNTI